MTARRARGLRRLGFALVTVIARLAVAADDPVPAAVASLGSLERQAVDAALLARGLRVDPAPDGKRIGTIHVLNHEVFSPRDLQVQLLNIFHRTTREWVIRREVLLAPGDVYSAALADESVRNLRDADFSSLVVILPVFPAAGTDNNRVDLFVVTRDVWSLRFNTEFDYGEGILRALSTSLSENNLFGWRKKASFVFNLGRSSYAIGPSYYDPNISGTRLTFSASARATYNLDSHEREGASIGATLAYPLYSLASRWGASLSASQGSGIARSYLGNNLRLVDLAATPETEALPYIYRQRTSGLSSEVTRSFGSTVIHRISGGHSLSVVRPSFVDDFPTTDPATRAAFAAAIFPRSERLSSVYLGYGIFTPRYRIYRDYETYDLREDANLGPSFSFSVSRAADWLGSDDTFTGLGAGAGWAWDLGDGRQGISVSWNARVRDGRLVDRRQGVSARVATPMLWRTVRVIAEGGASTLIASTRPEVRYSVGAETGLRGYATGEFQGTASYVGHLEARSAPLHVGPFRLGMVTYYDVGHAAPSLADLEARQDVGLGLRLLIPQLNFYVLRVDWAVPLQNGSRNLDGRLITQAGLPGRISAGFRQAF